MSTPAQALALKLMDDANQMRKAADDLTDLAHLILRVEAAPALLADMLHVTTEYLETTRKSLPGRIIQEKAG